MNRIHTFAACLLATTLTTAGCAANRQVSSLDEELAAKDRQIGELESTIKRLDAEGAATVAGAELLPPDAKAGECYTRVFVPPTYRTETEQVLEHAASERVEVSPPKYEWGTEEVLVKETSQRLEVVPAEYGWKEEQLLIKPASERLETMPATYEWVEETILVKPAHTTWKKGRGPVERIDNSTGEIMCLVEVPAQHRTVRKKVVKTPASSHKVQIPAEYKTIRRKVVVRPATTRSVEIPAKYDTVRVRKLASPAQERRIPIPATYGTVTKTIRTGEGRMEWLPILCETNMTGTNISRIQRSLKTAGYDPGPIDGAYGSQTRRALQSFQKAKGLPEGGLTIETLRALNAI